MRANVIELGQLLLFVRKYFSHFHSEIMHFRHVFFKVSRILPTIYHCIFFSNCNQHLLILMGALGMILKKTIDNYDRH